VMIIKMYIGSANLKPPREITMGLLSDTLKDIIKAEQAALVASTDEGEFTSPAEFFNSPLAEVAEDVQAPDGIMQNMHIAQESTDIVQPVLDNKPLDVQVGGDHYKSCAIQPVQYIHANHLGFCEGSVVKYVTRHKSKNGKQDLLKARHLLDLLISLEYPEDTE